MDNKDSAVQRWTVDKDDLEAIFERKYCKQGAPNWGPALRKRHDYYTPDDFYEALLLRGIGRGMNWLDVGCGRDIFPSAPDLASELCERCETVAGVDPDPNVLENEFITDAFHGMIEDYDTDTRFDLVTMRMVAEHIANPDAVLDKVASLLKPGGTLILVTPSKWAPLSIAATVVPFSLHHPIKRILWQTEAQDTFPTEFKMNTHRQLSRLADKFEQSGLDWYAELVFEHLDDCRVFGRFKLLNRLELNLRKAFNAVRLPYPENCILAVYQYTGTETA